VTETSSEPVEEYTRGWYRHTEIDQGRISWLRARRRSYTPSTQNLGQWQHDPRHQEDPIAGIRRSQVGTPGARRLHRAVTTIATSSVSVTTAYERPREGRFISNSRTAR